MAYKWFRKHTASGEEIPDPTPIEITMPKPLTIQEQLRRFESNAALQQMADKHGVDSFDDANDFGPDEAMDNQFPGTPYEMKPMAEDEVLPVQTRMDEMRSGIIEEQPQERVQAAKSRVFKQKPQAPMDKPSDK